MDEFRVVHDSMGEMRVPAAAKWGAQTQRAVENFPISGEKVDRVLLASYAQIKSAAARVNMEFGLLDVPRGTAIVDAADEVAAGGWDHQFPIDVFQTGSGTSTNMNLNEVIAQLASERSSTGEPIHPNDHVNCGQSSNDTFPTATQIAVAKGIAWVVVPELERLCAALQSKAEEFAEVVKAGRTHLMDATPVTLGQEFSGYAYGVELAKRRLEQSLPTLCELPLGGTAVGTGINTPAKFAEKVIAHLADELDLPLVETPNHFASQGSRDVLVDVSAGLRGIAIVLTKIANDVRWMASGPTSGLAEIQIPELQPGSSIMPGKVNPVIPEVVLQVSAQVVGNDAAVAWGGAAGNFELNVMQPMMARNLLSSIRLLGTTLRSFTERCIEGIDANRETCLRYAEQSPAVGTVLNTHIGYESAAKVIKQAMSEGRSVREVVVDAKMMTADEAEQLLDVQAMTKGGR